jgi:hypothetical protein
MKALAKSGWLAITLSQMKNLQNHFSLTKFHSCRSNFTSKKKIDLLAYSHLKIAEITTIFGLSGVFKEQSRNLEKFF